MEEKCEKLMNEVVETRKVFGKKCVDYDQKISLMENKILNLQLETISNFRSKSKNTVSNLQVEDMAKDIDAFAAEIVERKKRVDHLRKKLKDTREIVGQLERDGVTKKIHRPLSAEAMLNEAKEKNKPMVEKMEE